MSLSEPAVADFLARRVPSRATDGSSALHQRTGGDPLFLVQIVDALIEQGMLKEGVAPADSFERLKTMVPASVVEMVDGRSNHSIRRSAKLLERAAVAGLEFSAAAIAGTADSDGIMSAEPRLRGSFAAASISRTARHGGMAGRYNRERLSLRARAVPPCGAGAYSRGAMRPFAQSDRRASGERVDGPRRRKGRGARGAFRAGARLGASGC